MSEHAMDQLIEKIECSQWRVSISVGLASILLAVFLAWLLARNDIAYIHEMIHEAQCKCRAADVADDDAKVTANSTASTCGHTLESR